MRGDGSPPPSRRRQSSSSAASTGRSSHVVDDDGASVGSLQSKTSARSHRSDRSDDRSGTTGESAGTTGKVLPRKGLLHHIRQLASKVKNTLGELGGLNGVHRFKLGERARYKTVKIRDKNWMIAEGKYDVMTMTAEGKLLAVI